MGATPEQYKAWLAAKAEQVAKGDAGEYLVWYMEHPSPLATGLFGRDLAQPELVHSAIESTALSFKGIKVVVEVSGTPEAMARTISSVTGTLGGLGFVVTGGKTEQAVVVQDEHSLVMIPVRNVVDMENAR